MKSHAVPQEIMSMEFKLFGNFMTLREFIFIAAGVAIAWFLYLMKNAGVIPGILAWPGIIIFGMGGAVFGLLPFQDRTLDKWLINFIMAIRKPTKRIWKKPGFEPSTDSEREIVSLKSKIVTPMKSKPKSTKKITSQEEKVTEQQVDQKVEESLSKIDNTINQVEKGLTQVKRETPEPSQTLTPQPQEARPQPAVQTQVPQTQAQPEPVQTTIVQQKPPQPVTPPQQTQTETQQYKPRMITEDNLEEFKPQKEEQKIEKSTLKKISDLPEVEVPTSSNRTIEINEQNIDQYASKETTPNIKPLPNTINIIVKDSAGKIVEDVVSVIKNEEGTPIRAAVSNEFGQIINNNPLDNGKYAVTLSKEGMNFPDINIEMKGKDYPILEITAQ